MYLTGLQFTICVDIGLTRFIDWLRGVTVVLYRNIDQKLVNSLHGLLNCEIGGLDFHAIV